MIENKRRPAEPQTCSNLSLEPGFGSRFEPLWYWSPSILRYP